MDVIIERSCGMDVHKDSITACVMTPEGKEIQTFSTKTVFLLKLIDWIKRHGCTHVAMESTGVFWKPIVNLLEAEDRLAHAMLRIAYYLLTRKEMYVDLGEDYFEKHKHAAIVRNSVRRLENLGFSVSITEVS